MKSCCISFDSYIKPQPYSRFCICNVVVYLLIPTSNHNLLLCVIKTNMVVYLLIPTSNHNPAKHGFLFVMLYIF